MRRFTKTQLRRGDRAQDSAGQPEATSADEQAFLLGEATIQPLPPPPRSSAEQPRRATHRITPRTGS